MKTKSNTKSKIFKILAVLLCFLFCFEQTGFAQVATQLDIAGHLGALRNSLTVDRFRPLHLRYLQYLPETNNFKLLLDKGNLNPSNKELEDTSKDLLKYFFIGLSLPNDSFWVNLRPDSPDNIIDPLLAQTDVGKILLEADLQLKKDTASFTSPDTPEGKEYWDKLYQKAGELFGYENITIPTLTRPWIVPDEIIIRETTDSAYIYKATLKVMLEQDYLKGSQTYDFKDDRLKELNEYSSQLIREFIIPKITQEVNTSKKYAPLRQVYYSLIMAQWFKARYANEQNEYTRLINRNDLTGLTSKENWSISTYFQAYQKSFKDGEYNYQEPVSTPYGQVIRSYFSGGFQAGILAPSNPGTTAPTLGGGTASRQPAQQNIHFGKRFLASLLVLVGLGSNATSPLNATVEASDIRGTDNYNTPALSPISPKMDSAFAQLKENLRPKAKSALVDLVQRSELDKLVDNLLDAIAEAHLVGISGQGPYTDQEIWEKARILNDRMNDLNLDKELARKIRRVLIEKGVTGLQERMKLHLSPDSQTQTTQQDKYGIPAHVEINISGGQTVHFVLDKTISETLNTAGIDPEELIKEAIAKTSGNPLLSTINFQLHILGDQSTVWVFKDTEIDKLAPYISKNILKQLLFLNIWNEISRQKTTLNRIFGSTKSSPLNDVEYLRQELNSDQIINLWMGHLKAQVPFSFALSDLNDNLRRDWGFRCTKEQMLGFKKFYEENKEAMDTGSIIPAISCLTFLIFRSGSSKDLKAELDRLLQERGRLEEINTQISRIRETALSYDFKNPPIQQLITAYENLVQLDPNSISDRAELARWRQRLLEQQEETWKRAAAVSVAQSLRNASVNELLNAAIDALLKKDFFSATEILKVFSTRESVSLPEINLALSLLTKAVADYKEANQLFKRFILLYRRLLIREALRGFGFSSGQQETIESIYLFRFSDPTSERQEAISTSPELRNIDSQTIMALENKFASMKGSLAGTTVSLNRYLAETHPAARNPEDITRFLRIPAEQPVRKTLSDILKENVGMSPQERLNLALQYFQTAYDITLQIPFAENTSFVDIPINFGSGTKAILYSRNEIEELLSQFVLLDGYLSVLPAECVLYSLTVQKMLIVKNIRASWSHSEAVKHNIITLGLGEAHWRRVLYHEFGHSLHGPKEDFAAYISALRLCEIILRFRAFFEAIDPTIVQTVESADIETIDTGSLLWRVFQAIFKVRLQEWTEFNKSIGIKDLNVAFKTRGEKVKEEYRRRFGITTEGTETAPSLNPEYMFEKPLMDIMSDRDSLVRDDFNELLAEYVQLYILFPGSLKRLDPMAYEFINAILGSIHSRTTIVQTSDTARRDVQSQTQQASLAMGRIAINLLEQMANDRGNAELPMLGIMDGYLIKYVAGSSDQVKFVARTLRELGMDERLASAVLDYYIQSVREKGGPEFTTRQGLLDFLLFLTRTLPTQDQERARKLAMPTEKQRARHAQARKIVGEIARKIITMMSQRDGYVLLPFIEIKDGMILQIIYARGALRAFGPTLEYLGFDSSSAYDVSSAFTDMVEEYPYIITMNNPESVRHFLKYLTGGLSAAEGTDEARTMDSASSADVQSAFRILSLDPATATKEDVTAAFRKKAKETHPDKTNDLDSEPFIKILNARNICINYLQSQGPRPHFGASPNEVDAGFIAARHALDAGDYRTAKAEVLKAIKLFRDTATGTTDGRDDIPIADDIEQPELAIGVLRALVEKGATELEIKLMLDLLRQKKNGQELKEILRTSRASPATAAQAEPGETDRINVPAAGTTGGIDFRSLPIVTQAIGNLRMNMDVQAISRLRSADVNRELEEIQRMVDADIIPSAERIKEYVQMSCAQGSLDMDKIISAISDILRIEEERCSKTDMQLRDILVLLEAMNSTQELKAIFLAKAV